MYQKKAIYTISAFVVLGILVSFFVYGNSLPVSILNFGDIMFDRGVRLQMDKGNDPFQYMHDLNRADVVIANLEGPIIETDRGNCQQKPYSFQFAKTTPELLLNNHITLVNLSNNHSYDCLRAGLQSTRTYLDNAGIGHFGGGSDIKDSYMVKSIQGKKVAFVGIDQTISPIPVPDFYPLVKKLKSENDYVIVNIHWGTEYSFDATPVQEDIAHNLIDNGVDVIFGHHPHVIEPIEIYKGKPIFYSLGNFIFDQFSPETTAGIGAKVVLQGDQILVSILPFKIKASQPKFLDEKQSAAFCSIFLKNIPAAKGCLFQIN